ncbi:dipeptidase [Nostocoides australiense]|mgnify:CR=1 FL=1|nr:dipeptidase [Tetrasphaera australiensis]HRW01700.1 dipeptidase [Tetrasphaera sp.]
MSPLDLASLLAADPIVDGHNDLPWELRDLEGYDFDQLDIAVRGTRTHTDLVRLREGGVGGQFWSVFAPGTYAPVDAVTATFEQLDCVHRMVARYADQLALATTAEQVRAAWADGRIACLLGAEGGHCIANSVGTLRMMRRLGVRYMTLTHNQNNDWADSATDEPRHGGLTDFGRDVVREMNRIGMLVDISHVAVTTMHAALDTSTVPVIASHSSARAITDHPRNVPDEVLSRLAAQGGVCMATFVPYFVNQDAADWTTAAKAAVRAAGLDPDDESSRAFRESYAAAHPAPGATLADVVAHVEHLREVAGIDHIGLGGDYDGVDQLPQGLEDVSTYPRLLAVLAERGWSAADLAKLTSRNILRVLQAADDATAGT